MQAKRHVPPDAWSPTEARKSDSYAERIGLSTSRTHGYVGAVRKEPNMVMGPTHAMSGAALGLGIAALLPSQWGGPTTAAGAFIFAGVTAGAALLPDLDSPQATIARSFGPLTTGLAHLTETAALGIHTATKTSKDNDRHNGHRTATHTVWFAVLAGIATAAAVGAFGKNAAIAILFVMLGLALRGVFPAWTKQNDFLAITGVSAVLACGAWITVPAAAGAIALGAAVTAGIITHLAGDALTKQGVPLLGGIVKIRGKLWWDFALPATLRIKANGLADKALLAGFTLASIALAFHTINQFSGTAPA
jgi:membrane-bound metal-dependent hydrolase YbcI (DUF457 family)